MDGARTMHPAPQSSRDGSKPAFDVTFDAVPGRLTMTGALRDQRDLMRLRQGLERAMYSDAPQATIDLTATARLPVEALREIEVATCLARDMGRNLRLITVEDTAPELALRTAEIPCTVEKPS
jgi:hypothetical protein